MKFKKHPERLFAHFVSAPFIYMMIIPSVFLDICLEVYHRVCFPLYGIPYVKRKNYIIIDRQKLSYLTAIEKLHCMYCGYVNGLFAYAVAVAGKTEEYWCGIKHRKYKEMPVHHKDFLTYGNEAAFCKLYKKHTFSHNVIIVLLFAIVIMAGIVMYFW